jgi:hypothetical protein
MSKYNKFKTYRYANVRRFFSSPLHLQPARIALPVSASFVFSSVSTGCKNSTASYYETRSSSTSSISAAERIEKAPPILPACTTEEFFFSLSLLMRCAAAELAHLE